MKSIIKILILICISQGTPIYADDCNQDTTKNGVWSDVSEASDKLSNFICRRLKGISDEGSQTGKNLFGEWKSIVINSAGKIDNIIGIDEPNKLLGLASIYIEDVGNSLSPVIDVDGLSKDVSIADNYSLPSVSNRRKDDKVIVNTISANENKLKRVSFEITDDQNNTCLRELSKSCSDAVEDWSSAVSTYKGSVVRLTAEAVSLLAVEYSKEWERFYNEARAQTFIDTFYTANRYSRELAGDSFVKPPKTQYFLFRPGVVLEYIKDANDGEQFRETLSFEWYGFNYWKGCPYIFEKACGISLVSTYSDRASADDHGFGLMFHYDNNMSLGVVKGMQDDEDVGYFVTIDLLKAVENKQERVRAWKKELKDKF